MATLVALAGALGAVLAGVDPLRHAPWPLRLIAHAAAAPLLLPLHLAQHVASAALHPGRSIPGAAVLDLLLVAVAIVQLLRPATRVAWAATVPLALLVTHVLTTSGTFAHDPGLPWVLAGVGLGLYANRRAWGWVAAIGIAVAALSPPVAIALAVCLLAFGHGELVRRAVAVLAIAAAPLVVVLAGELARSASTQALVTTSRVVPTLLLLTGAAVVAWRLGREYGLTVA